MASGFYLFFVIAVIVTLILVAGPLWDKKRQLWAELDWRERLMLCLAALAFPCIIWLPVFVLIMASPYLPWLENIIPKSLAPAERLGSDHPSFGRSLNNMAELYRAEARYTEAELLFKRALALHEKASGPDHPDVSLPLCNIAELYRDQGRYVEAEALYRRALAIREKAFGPDHPTIGIVLSNLAELYRTQGRYDEAEPLYRRVLAIYEIAFGPNHPNTGDGLNNLALLLRDQGRYAEAEPRLKRSLAIRHGSLGADHPDVGIGLNNLAELYFAQGRYAEAVPVYKRSLVILETVLDGRSSRESDRNTSSAREMFQIAQLASDAAASLAQMAARGVKDDLRLVERDLQDLFLEWQKRDGARPAAIPQAPDSRDRAAEMINETRLHEIDRRLAEIDERQRLEIPEHAAFRHLEPLNARRVQANLGSDEALVLYLDIPGQTSAPKETIAWVISKTDVRWQRISVDTNALTENVTALRCGLDPMLWKDAQSADQCRALVQLSPVKQQVDGQTTEILPFDLTRAHTLYIALLGPFRDIVKDKSLLIVPSRQLTRLPFNVLVTESPKTAIPRTLVEYRDAAWLGTLQPITVLPSVSSMRASHQRAKTKSGASRTYLGIGNPLLDGQQEHPEWGQYYKEQAKASRDKQECPGTLAERRAEVATRPVISLKLRTQDPLPDTANELCEVGRRLGAPNSDILLGSRATEGALRNLSREGRLAQYRILHFATHCALTGQLQGVVEQGLVLTPTPMGAPDAGKLDLDDGFLTASEIAALKLDADWVVLSSCKPDNGGAVSSLASAFFYAGARRLLVSHWEAGSQSAIRLISGAVAELRAKPNLGRAEALRISMRNLMTNGSLVEAHPSLWAPFVVVGEGAAN